MRRSASNVALTLRRGPGAAAVVYALGVGACSFQESESRVSDSPTTAAVTRGTARDTASDEDLMAFCKRGSILVARVAPEEEEAGVSFRLLGDGAGPGVLLCLDDLYADAAALLALMGEQATVQAGDSKAIVDGRRTGIPASIHDGIVYVEVAAFARERQALLMRRADHRMDATIWPKETLLHMKTLGPERRGLYDSAVRAGLLPE